jgi:hypothetical protein
MIVGFVTAIFLGLAVVGWHFEQKSQGWNPICDSADAHCGERHI